MIFDFNQQGIAGIDGIVNTGVFIGRTGIRYNSSLKQIEFLVQGRVCGRIINASTGRTGFRFNSSTNEIEFLVNGDLEGGLN